MTSGWKYESYRHSLAARHIRTVFKKGSKHITKRGSDVIALSKSVKSKLMPYSKRIDVVGSIRRGVKDPVDIDIVVIPRDKEIIVRKLGEIGKIEVKGDKMVQTRVNGVDTDIYFATESDYGAQLMTRTGPWQGNLGNRTLAKNKGMLLNQYGLFDKKTGKKIASRTEKEIYEALGKKYKDPELRGLK